MDTVIVGPRGYNEVTDIWAGLGLEEIPDLDASETAESRGSQVSESEGEEELWSPVKRPR